MDDHYGMDDIRQYMNGRPLFPAIPQPEEFLSGHRNLTPAAHHYEMVMVGHHQVSDLAGPRGGVLHDFCSGVSAIPSASVTTSGGGGGNGTSSASLNGLEMMEIGGVGGGDGGSGRWPRQETLTLLEVRSRLDSKFKEGNQKGPLWDEVSRIMSEEHGFQRSGKKCREKFENLYKYYKKTKEGKAGRQDGKHYRFFRQLEALYGETCNPNSVSESQLLGNTFQYNAAKNPNQLNQKGYQPSKISESLSLSLSSDSDSSSSDDHSDPNASHIKENEFSAQKRKKRRGRKSWKVKIREFIDVQMRKMIEKQEAWLEKMMKIIEHKEEERMLREEEWMKQEAARRDRELKFWANQRAWIEARDSSLMGVLKKLTGKELMVTELQNSENQNESGSETMITHIIKEDRWEECEITRLIQLRNNMEQRFQQIGCSEEVLWEEIAAKMVCFGHDRSASMCKNKWDSVNNYLVKCNKKKRDNPRSSSYFQNNDSIYNGGNFGEGNEQGLEITRVAPNESFSRFLMGDADNLWENIK